MRHSMGLVAISFPPWVLSYVYLYADYIIDNQQKQSYKILAFC